MEQDVRWKQRFDNFLRAFRNLKSAKELSAGRELSDLEKQGVIQGFEYTHELAWNVLKDYLEEQGFVGLIGSKNTCREAFKQGLIRDGETWMSMIKMRNTTSHTYQENLMEPAVKTILTSYIQEFKELENNFRKRLEE